MCFGTQQPGVQSQDQGNSKVPESWLLSSFPFSLEQDTHVDWVTQRCSLIRGLRWDLKNNHIETARDYLGIVSTLLVIIIRTLQLENTNTHTHTNTKTRKSRSNPTSLFSLTNFICIDLQVSRVSIEVGACHFHHCSFNKITI